VLLDRPHHDGSEAYVLDRPDELGRSATLATVLGGDATCAGGIAALPGHGPAFHTWRLAS
jgi:hypothetical protein